MTPGEMQQKFRHAMSETATPVSVVTTCLGDQPHGTTVSAFNSLSMAPPMMMVALDKGSALLGLVRQTGRFAVNVLAEGQDDLAAGFARKLDGAAKFRDVDWSLRHGLPQLAAAPVWVACALDGLVEGGDHMIALGTVEDVLCAPGAPLLYHARRFAGLRTASAA